MLQNAIFQQTGVFWVFLLTPTVFTYNVNHTVLSLIWGSFGHYFCFTGSYVLTCDLQGKKAVRKFRNFMDNSQGMNQHQLLNITSHLKPIPPPPPPPRGRGAGENRPEPWRRRRFRPITAPNGLEPLFTRVITESSFLLLI